MTELFYLVAIVTLFLAFLMVVTGISGFLGWVVRKISTRFTR